MRIENTEWFYLSVLTLFFVIALILGGSENVVASVKPFYGEPLLFCLLPHGNNPSNRERIKIRIQQHSIPDPRSECIFYLNLPVNRALKFACIIVKSCP